MSKAPINFQLPKTFYDHKIIRPVKDKSGRVTLQFTKKRYIVLYGGRGGAKSWCVAALLLLRGRQERLRILCTREIQNTIKDSVHKLLSDWIDRLGLSGFYEIKRDSIIGRNGTEFMFKGLRYDPNGIKSTEGVDICWVEEAHCISRESWDILIPTIRKDGSQIWITFNPDLEDDPTYQDYVKNTPPDTILVNINYTDNPFFPEVLRREMEHCKATNYEKYLHVWLGHCRTFSDAQVLKGKYEITEFTAPENVELLFGADWGYGPDPVALTRSYETEEVKDGITHRYLWVEYELYGHGVELDDIPKLYDTIPRSKDFTIIADKSRPDTISFLQRHGYGNMQPCEGGAGSVEDGVEYLRGYSKIFIHPRCTNVIDEFKLFSYKQDKRTGEVLPILKPGNDHCIFADSLIAVENGTKKMKDILPGDMVLTRRGFKKVISHWCNGEKEIKVLQTENSKLKATGNHIILTNRGWKELDDMLNIDIVLEIWKEKLLYMKGGNTTGIRNRIEDLKECISRKALCIFIEKFGKIIVALSPADVTSTIKTGILEIIISLILKCLLPKNTLASIRRGCQKNSGNKDGSILKKSETLPKTGTHHLRGRSGIANTGKWFLNKENISRKTVSFVGNLIEHRRRLISFAQMCVNLSTDDNLALMISNGFVVFVVKNSKSLSTAQHLLVPAPARTYSEKETGQVFDMTVEGEHEFFADGVLVHNCVDTLRYATERKRKARQRAGAEEAKVLESLFG